MRRIPATGRLLLAEELLLKRAVGFELGSTRLWKRKKTKGDGLVVAEKTGHIDSSGGHAQRPLAMSRHRFLMLGASIVGVGMLPFAQRKYAYAASNVST